VTSRKTGPARAGRGKRGGVGCGASHRKGDRSAAGGLALMGELCVFLHRHRPDRRRYGKPLAGDFQIPRSVPLPARLSSSQPQAALGTTLLDAISPTVRRRADGFFSPIRSDVGPASPRPTLPHTASPPGASAPSRARQHPPAPPPRDTRRCA
jgi:hypothetical protein